MNEFQKPVIYSYPGDLDFFKLKVKIHTGNLTCRHIRNPLGELIPIASSGYKAELGIVFLDGSTKIIKPEYRNGWPVPLNIAEYNLNGFRNVDYYYF